MAKNKNNKNSFGSSLIVILLLILGIFFIISLVLLSINQKNSISSYFNKDSINSSEKIYNSLIELNEENYPDSPEKVVELYTESYKLLYGGRIKEKYVDELVPLILEKQRILFSDELINLNPIEQQIASVKNSIKFFEDEKLKIVSIEINPIVYDQNDSNKAYFNIVIQDNSKPLDSSSIQNYYYKYYLKKDYNNKWRITGFYQTDSQFNLIN